MSNPFERFFETLRVSIRRTEEDNEWTMNVERLAGFEIEESKSEQAELLYDEARTVLDTQIDTLNDIDDKAARTVRITALLVGGVFGAVSFGDSSSLVVNQYTWWGCVLLLTTVVFGMTTYSQSSPYVGPKPDDWEKIIRACDSKKETIRLLVFEGYGGWVEYNDQINEIDSYFLALTQWALATSLGLFGAGLSVEFTNGESFLPRFPALVSFSYSHPLVPFPLTPASVPVLLLVASGLLLYLYSLVVKSRMS